MWRELVLGALLLGIAGSVANAEALRTPVWGPPTRAGTIADSPISHELNTVDLNRDGLRDVIVGRVVFDRVQPVAPLFFLNRGGGRFEEATSSLFDGPPPAVEWNRQQVVADFNGDGRPDLFIADMGTDNTAVNPGWPGQQNRLVLSTPGGKLADATGNLPQRFTFTHSAAAADVNGDGAVDIFENNLSCCGRDRVPARILLNDGTGRFTPSPHAVDSVPRSQWGDTHSYASAFADVDGDRAADLVLGSSEQTGPSVVLLNDGNGVFRFHESLPPKLYPPTVGFVIDMAATDVNGDGAVDLLFAESQNEPYYIGTRIQVLINDGKGHFSDETARRFPQQPEGRSWTDRLLVEDLDDDGRSDLAAQFAPVGIIPEPDPTPFWLNRDGVYVRISAAAQGSAPNLRGPVGFVNGAGPHALFSIDSPTNGIPASFYVSPQIVPPPAPTRVRAASTDRGIRISWRSVAGAAQYEVRRNGARIGSSARTSFIDTRAPRGARFSYVVRAINAAGPGPFSAPAAARRR